MSIQQTLPISSPSLSWWLTPIGCKDKTQKQVQSWYGTNSSNIIQSSTPLTIGGFASAALGILFGAFGLGKESKSTAWFGVLLGAIGFAAAIAGKIFFNKLIIPQSIQTVPAEIPQTDRVAVVEPVIKESTETSAKTSVVQENTAVEIVHRGKVLKREEVELILSKPNKDIDEKSLKLLSQIVYDNVENNELVFKLENKLNEISKEKTFDELILQLSSKNEDLARWAAVALIANHYELLNKLVVSTPDKLLNKNVISAFVKCINLKHEKYQDVSQKAFLILKNLSSQELKVLPEGDRHCFSYIKLPKPSKKTIKLAET